MAADQSSISSDSHHTAETTNLGGSSGALDYNPGAITVHKLNGSNYLQWSHTVKLFMRGRGKMEYLTGEVAPPQDQEPSSYKAWTAENSLVMAWLLNSMTSEVGENFLLYDTACEMWEAVRETYSNKENTSELFEVESIIHDLHQGDMTVTQYYNKLTRLWQQVDMCETHQWSCSEDAGKFRQITDRKRVYKFLFGLNKNLDDVRGRIQGMRPSPTLREAFSEVRREESRRKVMLGAGSGGTAVENSALHVKGDLARAITTGSGLENSAMFARWSQSPAAGGEPKQRRDRPWCEHCKKPGHTKEVCWKLHGKPADWKSTKGNRGYIATKEPTPQGQTPTSPTDSNQFSREQMELLHKLIQQS